MRKPNHLGRTLRKQIAENGAVVSMETRELTEDEKAAIQRRKDEQAARLARIAARARGEEV